MRRRSIVALTACAGILLLSTAAAPAAARPAAASEGGSTFAVIGDTPYGDAALAAFPAQIGQINADRRVSWVNHLGDIKNGSSVCSDTYFAQIKQDFDTFADPLVYTIGDNEWTDCHRPSNGSYNPLERLAKVRQVFFPEPGRTLGRPAPVLSYASDGYPENIRYVHSRVSFASVHIVGSNNSMAPWTGHTTATPEQTAEVLGRTAAAIRTIHDAFVEARKRHLASVVLLTQADMFDPTVSNPPFADYYAFEPIVQAIARESAAFRGPVYLFNGDSHVFHIDRPLAADSDWLAFYHVPSVAANLHRITVDGSGNATDYLRVTIHPNDAAVLSWTRVPFTN